MTNNNKNRHLIWKIIYYVNIIKEIWTYSE